MGRDLICLNVAGTSTSASNRKEIEMRTRCKFRVVGIENVEHAIFKKVYKSDVSAEEYAAMPGIESTEYPPNPERRLGGGAEPKMYKQTFLANAQNIRLAAQYDPSIPEDQRFMEATPSGELKFYVSNPAVIGGFQIGKNYYVDLTPCE
jgi:hypothetical protein